TLVVETPNERQAVEDVLVGEVWLCSGQSNMAMTVSRAMNFDQERKAARFPQIRMFTVKRQAATKPQAECDGQWAVCSPETVGNFSATAYFFGRELHRALGVPVGLINSSWGGTDIAAWTSFEGQASLPELMGLMEQANERLRSFDPQSARRRYQRALARWKQQAAAARKAGRPVPRRPRPPLDPRTDPNLPANLFNGMIHPLIPFAMRGATWYQGERNSKTLEQGVRYALQLKTLIADWRNRWNLGPFPFLIVQLPNFGRPQTQPVETTGWVLVREAQLKAALTVPNVGLAITTDIGVANDIHPKNKQEVGRRLALWALGTTYGRKLVYSGPLYAAHELQAGESGNVARVVLRFRHVGDGLKSRDGKPLQGFAIAGPDRRFHWAKAEIVGPDTVAVWSDTVPEPAAVRYAWAPNPLGNLVNSAGLPASPFRTDGWPVLDRPLSRPRPGAE
ncbi:MAG: sialate O-acetylesterase, partial [Planctomycetota bacterium]